ncbi:hypothetical protein [uncultured Polaribacter sp.]|uniref:hypothetical protein n=1 Tax=uncultured Polaribacter sp. TaxID=174711 RepID=UPI00260E770F|nr:hypothetical protein [uncultured Polaribacter sp.]
MITIIKKVADVFGSQLKEAKVKNGFSLGKAVIAVFVALLSFGNANAQDDGKNMEDSYKPFKFGAHLKNMHLWHGFQVQSGPMVATNLEYTSRDSKFTLGFWGGASFASSGSPYKEFSTYAVYRFSDRFFTELVTHNNFTDIAASGVGYNSWAYDRATAYNFADLNFGYNFDKISLYYGVILFGQSSDVDRYADGALVNGSNLVYDANGDLTDSWTQYLEVKAKLFEKDGATLTGILGGAWSFHTDNTFYTQGSGNIINVGLALAKKMSLGNYKLPVEVMAMWNPERKETNLQLDITLF